MFFSAAAANATTIGILSSHLSEKKTFLKFEVEKKQDKFISQK